MARKHADVPRGTYSFRLNSQNVEKIRSRVPNLSEWVDAMFEREVKAVSWSESTSDQWARWLATRGENVREIARKWPPDAIYRVDMDPGAVYRIRQYVEKDGQVLLMCERDGVAVTGVPPEELKRIEE